MHHVHVIFTGIIALVAAAQQNGPMTAVVLNSPEPVIASDDTAIPPHVGWIMVERAMLADGSAQPDRVMDRNGVPMAIFLLRGEEIRAGSAPAEDLVLVDGLPAGGETATAANRSFLHWAARMREIWPGDHALNPAYFEADPDSQLVAGRMLLSGGTLSTDYVGERVWEFRPSAARHRVRHALAQQIEYGFDAAMPTEIVLKKFRSSDVRILRLNGDDVTIAVGNTPEDDIIPTGVHAHQTVDHHFELYYRLFEAPPANKPIPYLIDERDRRPVGPRLVAEPHRTGASNCPPLLIE